MFFDAPFLPLLADIRRQELLAEAEQHRLAKLARAVSRPPDRAPRPVRIVDAECRCPVPR